MVVHKDKTPSTDELNQEETYKKVVSILHKDSFSRNEEDIKILSAVFSPMDIFWSLNIDRTE